MTSAIALDLSFISPGARVLVAVSGGADSLALLLALHQAKTEIVAAHVNHGLRGQESDDDETFVVKLCGYLKIPVAAKCVQVALKNGRFSENDARIARYAALIEMARENLCSQIATGHTANDVLETVILNLARGATVGGLAGIAPHRVLEVGLGVVRPLLSATRTQTENFCRENNVSWRNDASNANCDLKRNLVRHQIVPLLGEVGNKNLDVLARQTARAANLWRDDLQFLDETAKTRLDSLRLRTKPNVLALDGLRFQNLNAAMQRRVLRLVALEISPQSEIGSEPVEVARRHIVANCKRIVWQWPREICVEWTGAKSGNRIRVWRVERTTNISVESAENTASNLL